MNSEQKNIKNIIIIGSGGHAGVLWDILAREAKVNVAAFSAPAPIVESTAYDNLPVISDEALFSGKYSVENQNVIIGIGNIKIRKKLIKKISEAKLNIITAVHPGAIISKNSKIGEGTAVMAGAVINPFVTIGRHCVINTGATVDHDVKIGTNVFVQPGAHIAGSVRVGDNSFIGIGASVKENIKIGNNCVIGGGAFVRKDVPDNTTVVGVPAEILNK